MLPCWLVRVGSAFTPALLPYLCLGVEKQLPVTSSQLAVVGHQLQSQSSRQLVPSFSVPKSLSLKFLRVSHWGSIFCGWFCVESIVYGQKGGGGASGWLPVVGSLRPSLAQLKKADLGAVAPPTHSKIANEWGTQQVVRTFVHGAAEERTADPSTPLRCARDDRSVRCAALGMTGRRELAPAFRRDRILDCGGCPKLNTDFPQRLKPLCWEGAYGTDESVPFQDPMTLGRYPTRWASPGMTGRRELAPAFRREGPSTPLGFAQDDTLMG